MKSFPVKIDKVYVDKVVSGSVVSAVADTNSAGASDSPNGQHSLQRLLGNIKGVIFDFDGTLFDNARVPFYLIAAWPFDILRIWKERLIRKRFTGCDYSTPEDYYNAFFDALGKVCFRSPQKIRNWHLNRYMPRMVRVMKKHCKLRQGVRELFRLFDGSSCTLRVAIYSDYPLLKERMEALDLNPGSNVLLYGPECFGAQKPAVRPFRRIAADMGAAPEEILVIGDREETDGLGAFRTGMHFFCLETGCKRYFRLDPCRRPPIKDEQTTGPSLLMYTGAWTSLLTLFTGRFLKDQKAKLQ